MGPHETHDTLLLMDGMPTSAQGEKPATAPSEVCVESLRLREGCGLITVRGGEGETGSPSPPACAPQGGSDRCARDRQRIPCRKPPACRSP